MTDSRLTPEELAERLDAAVPPGKQSVAVDADPLVQLATRISQTAPPPMPPDMMARIGEQVQQAAIAQAGGAAVGTAVSAASTSGSVLVKVMIAIKWTTALAATVIIAMLVGKPSLDSSKPGMLLYPVKMTVEEVERALAFSPVTLAHVQFTHAENRMHELLQLLESGQFNVNLVTQVLTHLEEATLLMMENGVDPDIELAARRHAIDAMLDDVIATVASRLPDGAEDLPLAMEDIALAREQGILPAVPEPPQVVENTPEPADDDPVEPVELVEPLEPLETEEAVFIVEAVTEAPSSTPEPTSTHTPEPTSTHTPEPSPTMTFTPPPTATMTATSEPTETPEPVEVSAQSLDSSGQTDDDTVPDGPTLTPSPTPFRAHVYAYAGSRVNVRTGPSERYDIVTMVLPGTTLDVVDQNEAGGWMKVQLLEENMMGWVAAYLLREGDGTNFIPPERPYEPETDTVTIDSYRPGAVQSNDPSQPGTTQIDPATGNPVQPGTDPATGDPSQPGTDPATGDPDNGPDTGDCGLPGNACNAPGQTGNTPGLSDDAPPGQSDNPPPGQGVNPNDDDDDDNDDDDDDDDDNGPPGQANNPGNDD